MTDEPRLQAEPREGVPDVIDTLPVFREYCSALASSHGSLAADAERASGFRYGHDDWLVQFKRDGAGIGLLDPQALAAEGADWNDFNRAVGDAVWILHDSLQDLRDSLIWDCSRNVCLIRKSLHGCWGSNVSD